MNETTSPAPKPRNGIPWRIDVRRRWLVLALTGAVGGGLALGRILGGLSSWILAEFIVQIVVLLMVLTIFAVVPPRLRLPEKLGVRPLRWRDVGIAFAGLPVIYAWQFSTLPRWERLLDRCGLEFELRQSILTECFESSPERFLAIAALTGVLIPIVEELVFRRVLFGIIRPLGVWFALLSTALIFAAAHGFLYGFPALFMLGAVFQCQYLVTGNLLTSVLTHVIYNLVSLSLTFLQGWLS